MATYMKPTSKLFDLPSRGSGELNLSDLMCPVCRGILIEPVTLPCAHNLCLRCLNGTIQHNSLSCPLCRVRVGSWLRTATKSDTLVNDALWKLIKTRFAKEIQAKNDGVETDLDSGFITKTNKIISAAGEIRREYEAQLQLAEEEIKRRRDAERLASEALIRKIQAEDRERISQLAKESAVTENYSHKNVADKAKAKDMVGTDRETRQGSGSYIQGDRKSSTTVVRESLEVESEKVGNRRSKDGIEWNSNIALISKLRAESYAFDMKSGVSNVYKVASNKYFLQKPDEPHLLVKHQSLINKIGPQGAQSYMPKPGCSNSKIYGTQSEEELHVPSDVLNRKKKSLGIEVCLATAEDDRRIGSAESTGSHDSINIEIHHFKPIKAMPRTPLRTMPDGRQIDPKLIRVVAILKRVQNAVPTPPTLMQLKRLSGCSYSAFKGKSKKILKEEQRPGMANAVKEELEDRPSTSHLPSQQQQTNSNKLTKPQISETVRRLDLSSEISYDGNKNYAKNISRIINGTKVSKKLILDEEVGLGRVSVTTNGDTHGPCKRRKQTSSSNNREESVTNQSVNYDSGDEAANSSHSANHNATSLPDRQIAFDGSDDAMVPAVENIAERIKKRKMGSGRSQYHLAVSLKHRRVAEKRTIATPRRFPNAEEITTSKGTNAVKHDSQNVKVKDLQKQSHESDKKIDLKMELARDGDARESIWAADSTINQTSTNVGYSATTCSSSGSKRATRNSARGRNDADSKKARMAALQESEMDLDKAEDEGVREQKRIEKLLRQEQKDFELAQRLQAKFDEMERISGRTRGSRRGGGSGGVAGRFNSKNIEQVLGGRTVKHDDMRIKDRFTRQLIIENDGRAAESQSTNRRVTRRRCV